MSYTKKEVIAKLQEITKVKTRVRNVIDRKGYLIAILYYKFSLTESVIGSYCDMKHSSINICKKKICDLYIIKDRIFLENIKDLYEQFPYELKAVEPTHRKIQPRNSVSLNVLFSHHKKQQLANYMSFKGITSESKALKQILFNGLSAWGK